jgi:hypothetical protein
MEVNPRNARREEEKLNDICETPCCSHRRALHTGGQRQDECTVVECRCKAFAATLFANQRPKPMTPVRACQVANQLIHRLETHALIPDREKPFFYINQEEMDALVVLRNTVAKIATGSYRTPGERRDGTFHVPK